MADTNFFWNPLSDNILQERDETGALTDEYTTEPGLYGNLISQNRGGVESQYHFDAIGSTLALTDGNQQLTDTYAYTAFGESSEQSGLTQNPIRFIGQQGSYHSDPSGVYAVRYRLLLPMRSVWLSADPTHSYAFTRYAYVDNMPLRSVDPSGTVPLFPGGPPVEDLLNPFPPRGFPRIQRSCGFYEEHCLMQTVDRLIQRIRAVQRLPIPFSPSCFGTDADPERMTEACQVIHRRNALPFIICRMQLTDCVLDTLIGGVKIDCLDQKQCSTYSPATGKYEKRNGFSAGACRQEKNTLPGRLVVPARGDELLFRDCRACSPGLLQSTTIYLCREGAFPKTDRALTTCSLADMTDIADTLIHEVLHLCIGKQESTNPDSADFGREGVRYCRTSLWNAAGNSQ